MKYAFRMKKAHSGKTATDCGIKMGKSQGLFMKFRSRRGIFFRWPSDLHPTVENTPDDHQAAGRPALWPPAQWCHGRRGRARRSSLSGRFRAPNLERKTPGGREAHRDLAGTLCLDREVTKTARGVRRWIWLSARSETRGIRARTRFGRLGRGKGSCGVGKTFIGLDLTPLARKS